MYQSMKPAKPITARAPTIPPMIAPDEELDEVDVALGEELASGCPVTSGVPDDPFTAASFSLNVPFVQYIGLVAAKNGIFSFSGSLQP